MGAQSGGRFWTGAIKGIEPASCWEQSLHCSRRSGLWDVTAISGARQEPSPYDLLGSSFSRIKSGLQRRPRTSWPEAIIHQLVIMSIWLRNRSSEARSAPRNRLEGRFLVPSGRHGCWREHGGTVVASGSTEVWIQPPRQQMESARVGAIASPYDASWRQRDASWLTMVIRQSTSLVPAGSLQGIHTRCIAPE